MMTTRMSPVAASGDAELVNASLAGSREAFGQIVSRYQSLVCSLAYSATGSLSQSEDLAQETFLAAWKDLAKLHDPPKLRAWLCGIARNLIGNSLRRQRREPSHRAATLEQIPESPSPEPLPVERAISREEAEILWRSLERIPETYREPLVLFYREHQSVEAVAQNLELTEEAVRQRLSRGRKLLEAEVMAFVEGALEKTAPGKTFTVAVVSALPLVASSAKAATVGVAVAKSAAGAPSILPLTALAGLLSMLGAVLFSWKTSVDESKSPRERRFMVRLAWFQMLFFVVSLGVSFFWFPMLFQRPWVFGPVFALLILANVANGILAFTYGVRRRVEIMMEEGTMAEAMPGGPDGVSQPNALRRTLRLTIPFLILLGVGCIWLPWKEHWLRSAVVVAVQALVILWFVGRTYRHMSFQARPRFSMRPAVLRHPFLMVAVILFGTLLLAGVGGYLLPFFLHPEWAPSGIPFPPWLRPLGISLLVAGLAVAAVAAVIFAARRKIVPHWKWLADKLDRPFLRHVRTMTQGPAAVAEMTYAPLFQQLKLEQEQRVKLRDLVLMRTAVGVRASLGLMNRRLDPAKRAALVQEIKSETDAISAQIKEFLGEEMYALFRQFERTIPERTMLNQFNRRHARTAAALTSEQEARLLEALAAARDQFPWTTEFSRRKQDIGDYAALLTKNNLDTFAQEEEQFDRQFLTQAQALLNPEQLAAFGKAEAGQRRTQIAQVKMAARLFAPKSSRLESA